MSYEVGGHIRTTRGQVEVLMTMSPVVCVIEMSSSDEPVQEGAIFANCY